MQQHHAYVPFDQLRERGVHGATCYCLFWERVDQCNEVRTQRYQLRTELLLLWCGSNSLANQETSTILRPRQKIVSWHTWPAQRTLLPRPPLIPTFFKVLQPTYVKQLCTSPAYLRSLCAKNTNFIIQNQENSSHQKSWKNENQLIHSFFIIICPISLGHFKVWTFTIQFDCCTVISPIAS